MNEVMDNGVKFITITSILIRIETFVAKTYEAANGVYTHCVGITLCNSLHTLINVCSIEGEIIHYQKKKSQILYLSNYWFHLHWILSRSHNWNSPRYWSKWHYHGTHSLHSTHTHQYLGETRKLCLPSQGSQSTILPLQFKKPSPEKPLSQTHSKLPTVFIQDALAWQVEGSEHSFTSAGTVVKSHLRAHPQHTRAVSYPATASKAQVTSTFKTPFNILACGISITVVTSFSTFINI